MLRRYREAAGVSQEALAARAELHRNYVGLLERGKQVPTLLVVEKLAGALGMTMSSIIRDVEKEDGKTK
ncbi:helix-turn-helix domain-containing protein [Gemmata massiliana]|uniref:helix-turn-helix domain-containing protein n=1 Tax=Gemmata massiliana TaxID=1210884 RepID=UPI001E3DD5E9|nr:helix-turn-helix transcriptional regulator [Gemmata massiliana]